MKFLADENFEPQFVESLRGAGYEVLHLDEYDAGIGDTEILQIAVEENAVVITNDKDFRRTDFPAQFCVKRRYILRLYELPLATESS